MFTTVPPHAATESTGTYWCTKGGAAGVPDAVVVLDAGAMTGVWPHPELAGSGGQGHGFTGRWTVDRVTKGQRHKCCRVRA
jgi:hypothetical protein